MQERRGGGDRSEGREGSNVPNAPYHPCGAQRSNDDASPEAGSDRADLSEGETLDFARILRTVP
jgi:hypothetical protein